MKMLECNNCWVYFNPDSSSASLLNRTLFCSSECEAEDKKALEHGNELIKLALKENPFLFEGAQRPSSPKTAASPPSPSSNEVNSIKNFNMMKASGGASVELSEDAQAELEELQKLLKGKFSE